jgi:hypothetical protein
MNNLKPWMILIAMAFFFSHPTQAHLTDTWRWQDQALTMEWQSLFLLPGESGFFLSETRNARIALPPSSQGRLIKEKPQRWVYTAPSQPGAMDRLELISKHDPNSVRVVQIFVLWPSSELQNGMINGFRIGHYPQQSSTRDPNYIPPKGFVEIKASNVMTKVSPHFTLGQFQCKQTHAYPQYILLNPGLLNKLEMLLARVQSNGIPCTSFHIMSGYRTPHYNQMIGNVRFSAHVWGRAADIFIDEDNDGHMDDLYHDGQIDFRDAGVLYDLVEELEQNHPKPDFLGGMGLYARNLYHGPFLHLDVRGVQARWGLPWKRAPRILAASRKKIETGVVKETN